jgi:hypothetical protein
MDLNRQLLGSALHRTTQTQKKGWHTSIPRAGFEIRIPVFERAKTFRALYHAALWSSTIAFLIVLIHIMKDMYLEQRRSPFIPYLFQFTPHLSSYYAVWSVDSAVKLKINKYA